MAETPTAETGSIIRPLQAFEDNIRPAKLMLQVYRLLDCGDAIQTDGAFVDRLRALVAASASEDLMVVQNEIFLGLVRERAQLPKSALKTAALCHLLRQAIVASCTGLDALLPALLRVHLPFVMKVAGRDVFAPDDAVREYCRDLHFSLDEVLRLLPDDNATLYISNRLLRLSSFKYLGDKTGVHVVAALLGLPKPWDAIARHLGREKKELMAVLDETVKRRNDIVHRADRPASAPDGEPQAITYAQAMQGVGTIEHVCYALNELIDARLKELAKAAGGTP